MSAIEPARVTEPAPACACGVDTTESGECGQPSTWAIFVELGEFYTPNGPFFRCSEHVAFCVEFHCDIASTQAVHLARVGGQR